MYKNSIPKKFRSKKVIKESSKKLNDKTYITDL